MVYPFNTNKIEKLALDPIKQIDGIVWFNTSEQVYKSYVNGELNIFITDKTLEDEIQTVVDAAFLARGNNKFILSFTDTTSLIVKHNKESVNFTYQLFDSETNTTVMATMEIIDENEIKIDFIDSFSGRLFLQF